MRFRLTWLMLAPCMATEELPPHVQSLLNVEPYAEYAAEQVPLPPSDGQMAAMSRHLFLARGCVMKSVLYRGMARTRAAGWRETAENLAQMYREAATTPHAPREFVQILQLQTDRHLSRPRAYALRSAREHLLQQYAVDELQMRLLLDSVDANEDEAEQILRHLPLQAVFNMVPQKPLTTEEMAADLRLYADIQTQATRILSSVQNKETALAVLPELKGLLLLHDTTLPTRAQLMEGKIHSNTPQIEEAAKLLGKAAKQLREQRNRLNEQKWFGCKELQALDFLLN